MKSPFPGMDPYLERHWGDVHARLTTYASDEIQRALPRGLTARIEEEVFIEDPKGQGRIAVPDVMVYETTGGSRYADGGGVAVAEPETEAEVSAGVAVFLTPYEKRWRWIEIREKGDGGRLVTVVEILSLSNKLYRKGVEQYLSKREECLLGGANFVEIDLLRAGKRVSFGEPGEMPEDKDEAYMAFVFRPDREHEVILHPLSLRKRLPALPIPLRPTDRPVLLNLQTIVERAYENGRYDEIDYRRAADPPLAGEDAAWADGLLKGKGLR